MLKRRLKFSLSVFLAPLFIRRFKQRKQACRTLGEHIDLVEQLQVGWLDIRPYQIRSELEALLNELLLLKPKSVLELGTAHGGTLYLLARVAAPDACLIGIDLPRGDYGRGYPKWKRAIFQLFGDAGQEIHFVGANSHATETRVSVERILAAQPLDFLLIDGDHSYEGVKQDFELYSTLVRANGMIAFHDIVPGPINGVGGVPQYWQEIKASYRHQEIVENWNQPGYGIGVLWKGG